MEISFYDDFNNDSLNGLLDSTVYKKEHDHQYEDLGFLFASKAVVQSISNPLASVFITKFGSRPCMIYGLIVSVISTLIFAFSTLYWQFFIARSLQGFGSAFADTAGLALLGDYFVSLETRTKALGVAVIFIYFGSLFGPLFGGLLYQYYDKELPFIILSSICALCAVGLILLLKPLDTTVKVKCITKGEYDKHVTSFCKSLWNPQVMVCSGALIIAKFPIAFLEPTISRWMEQTISSKPWQTGFIWMPGFIPLVLGVYGSVYLIKQSIHYAWYLAAVSLFIEGCSAIIVPFLGNYCFLVFPLSVICVGVGVMESAMLSLLYQLCQGNQAAAYAIANMDNSIAYVVGPILAGYIVANLGFVQLALAAAALSIFYALFVIGYYKWNVSKKA